MVYLWRSSTTGTLTFLCTFLFCSLRFITLISYSWLKPKDIDYGTGESILFRTRKKKETSLRYKASSSLTFMVSGRDVAIVVVVVVVAVVFVCVVVAINIL